MTGTGYSATPASPGAASAGITYGTPAAASTPATPAASAASPSAAVAGAASPLTPTYLSQLFPNGIPQQQTQTAAPSASTNTITQQILASLQPQFGQQDSAMTEALANAGIVGGSTTGAMGNLGLQQQQQAMGEMAPYIMQGIGDTNQVNEFNAGSENSGGEYNISNLLNAGMYDSTAQMNQEDELAGLQNSDYLSQLGLQGNLISSGAGAQAGAYQPVYSQPSAVSTGGIGSALGNFASSPIASSVSGDYGGLGTGGDAFGSGEDYSGSYYGVS